VRGLVARNDQRALYALCDAAAFPYRWVRTGFPLVVPEAVAAGLPTMTTRVYPLRELEGKTGIAFADCADRRGQARAVDRLLAGGDLPRLREKNRQWIESTPGWPEIARRYLEALRS
jgi:glycosyltransferase involved in cell wall biosynthesis